MSHFKVIKIIFFNCVFGLKMDKYFEPTNIISTIELNFEENHSRQRWFRVKEYFSQMDDVHSRKSFKDIRAILRDCKMYP